jgi:hypothetical protein
MQYACIELAAANSMLHDDDGIVAHDQLANRAHNMTSTMMLGQ